MVIQSVTFNALHVNFSDTVANPDGWYSAEIRQHVDSSANVPNKGQHYSLFQDGGITWAHRYQAGKKVGPIFYFILIDYFLGLPD